MDPLTALVGATVAFASAATLLAIGCRACRRHPRGEAALVVVAALTGTLVVLLLLDGRIGRYFPTLLWPVPIAGVVAGALAAGTEGNTSTALTLWTAVFVFAFAARLPSGVSLGSAATVGLAIEVLATLFVSVPGFVVGSLVVGLLRRQSGAGPDDGLRSA